MSVNKPGRPISLAAEASPAVTESQAIEEWGFKAMLQVKRGMYARGWGYQELSEALRPLGFKRSATVINRRINRGNFSAGFLLACLEVLKTSGTAGDP